MTIDTKIVRVEIIDGIPNFFNEKGEKVIISLSKKAIEDNLYVKEWPSGAKVLKEINKIRKAENIFIEQYEEAKDPNAT